MGVGAGAVEVCGPLPVGLADEAERCRGRDIELRLVSCKPRVSRIIKACELGDVLRVYPNTDSALAPAVA